MFRNYVAFYKVGVARDSSAATLGTSNNASDIEQNLPDHLTRIPVAASTASRLDTTAAGARATMSRVNYFVV